MEITKHVGNPHAMESKLGDNYSQLYSDINEAYSMQSEFLSSEEVDKLKGNENTTKHNEVDEKYNKKLEELVKKNEEEREELKHLPFSKYDTNPNMEGYGFFENIVNNATSQLEWENEEDIKRRYKKLLNQKED